MTPHATPPGRRIWVILCAVAAVAVVVLAWRVPEPQTHAPERSHQVTNVSYLDCPLQTPAPSYGARTMDNCIRQ